MPLGTTFCHGFVIRKADVRLRLDFQYLSRYRCPLTYSWAIMALETFSEFTISHEPREARLQILDGQRTVARLRVDWIP